MADWGPLHLEHIFKYMNPVLDTDSFFFGMGMRKIRPSTLAHDRTPHSQNMSSFGVGRFPQGDDTIYE